MPQEYILYYGGFSYNVYVAFSSEMKLSCGSQQGLSDLTLFGSRPLLKFLFLFLLRVTKLGLTGRQRAFGFWHGAVFVLVCIHANVSFILPVCVCVFVIVIVCDRPLANPLFFFLENESCLQYPLRKIKRDENRKKANEKEFSYLWLMSSVRWHDLCSIKALHSLFFTISYPSKSDNTLLWIFNIVWSVRDRKRDLLKMLKAV